MPEFLNLQTPEKALNQWLNAFSSEVYLDEEIDTASALGRVLASSVTTDRPIPDFRRSTMDGYALRAKDSFGASESLPAYFDIVGEVPMGSVPGFSLKPGETALIHTGGMVPEGADAVVMLEYAQRTDQGILEVTKAVAYAENVIQIGEDVTAGEVVIPAGRQLRAAEIGALMSLGRTKILVRRKPRIGIVSSGDEVLEPERQPAPGQIRDVNAYALSACIEGWGGEPTRLGIIPDDMDQLGKILSSAIAEFDAVLISAGSSASVRDHTAQVIDRLGSPGVIIHGVDIKPGKPTILAVCNGKPVVGLPGNPVSALVIARLFVKPMIETMLGVQSLPADPVFQATLTVNLPSQAGREDWWPVRLTFTENGILADPIFYKSNLIFTYAQAQGLIRIPADANGLAANSRVDVFPL